jgi:hypothetical protein
MKTHHKNKNLMNQGLAPDAFLVQAGTHDSESGETS